jgi:EPS-associated MarR family transcriptional regulator
MQAEIDLKLLKLLEENPALSQRQLANHLGISLGKTNHCLKVLKDKGLVKWGNFSNNPNKLHYMHLLTPKGIRQKLSLTIHFLERKQAEFDNLKKEIALMQAELSQQKPQLHRVKDSIGVSHQSETINPEDAKEYQHDVIDSTNA